MANKDGNGLRKWAIFTGIAMQMGIVIACGVFLGVYLDKKFVNSYSAFTVICSLTGVFLAMYSVIKQVQKFNKNDKDS
jgi:F0F1-type ATP synthase assembly protein I